MNTTVTPVAVDTAATAAAPAEGASVESSNAPVSPSSQEQHLHTDRPLVPLPSAEELARRREDLQREINELERAEKARVEAERAAAKQRALAEQEAHKAAEVARLAEQTAKVHTVAAYLGMPEGSTPYQAIKLMQSLLGREAVSKRYAGRAAKESKATVARKAAKGKIPAETKELILLAITNGATEKEVSSRFGTSPASFWIWKRQLRAEGKIAQKAKAPVKRRAAKRAKKTNRRGRALVSHPPYSAEIKEAVLKAMAKGASVMSLARETGISRPGLSIWKRQAGLVGKDLGRTDVKELIEAGKVPPLPKAA